MLSLNYPSDVVKIVFSAVEEFDATGKYPEITEDVFFNIIECVFELQIDSFINFLSPLIAQNILKLSERTIKMIPTFIIPKIVKEIPIDALDPDFIIKYFGFDLLYEKIQITRFKFNPLNTFSELYDYEETSPEAIAANTLFSIKPTFANSEFVREHATVVELKETAFVATFPNLKVLKLTSIEDFDLMFGAFYSNLKRLDITSTRLKANHIDEVLFTLESSNIVYLSLRDDRIGQIGCQKITDYLRRNPSTSLQYLDIGLNSIGADAISIFLEVAAQTTLKGVAIDGNFFRPSSNELAMLQLLKMPCISTRALHWDDATAVVIREVIEQDCIQWVDLSAQVIHQNSDPDLSGTMAEFVLSKASPTISTLIFANHRLDHMNFNCITRMNLTYLNLANSNLDCNEIEVLTDLVMNLEKLDLSYNNMVFKTNTFLNACARSKSLKFLSLSYNDIGDVSIAKFFDDLRENESNISVLRLSNCGLNKRSSKSLIDLLAAEKMSFKELDISTNSMFHVSKGLATNGKTNIEMLIVGGNGQKYEPFAEFLSVIKGIKYIDLDYVPISIIVKVSPLLKGIHTIRMCYTKIQKDNDLVELIKQSECHCLMAINSFSQRTFAKLMWRWAEIPSLLILHVEENLKQLKSTKIPVVFEYGKKF